MLDALVQGILFGGYYAILAMDIGGRRTGVVKFSVQLAEQLRPMIRKALQTPR